MSDKAAGAARNKVVRGQWVLATKDGKPALLRDHNVFIEGARIAAVTRDRPAPGDEVIECEQGLVLPGFINLHSHCINGAMFRGIPDDYPLEAPWMSRLIYAVLMPMAQLALETLTPADIRALVSLGMLDVLKGGTTTLLDQFHPGQEVVFDVAREMGIRFYGAPYAMSTANTAIGADGKPSYDAAASDTTSLDKVVALFKRHDGSVDGRIRVVLGPHAPDTCAPDLLRATRAAANDLGCLVTTHLAQTPEELEMLRRRYDKGPIEYLHSTGLLGPDLIVAHCTHATDDEIKVLKATDTVVANCVVSFARGGINVPLWRFAGAGVRTGVGTDSHGMDMVSELRTAGFFSKLHAESAYVATAHDLVRAATQVGADALRRPDLGRIEAGARADILLANLQRAHLQPVWDPVKNLIWKGSAADFAAIMVDGELIVRDRVYLRGDEAAIIRAASSAAERVWGLAEKAGVLRKPAYIG